MKNKFLYHLANIWLLLSMPVVLLFAMAGIDNVLDLRTAPGFVVMVIVAGHVMSCATSMAVHIKSVFIKESRE